MRYNVCMYNRDGYNLVFDIQRLNWEFVRICNTYNEKIKYLTKTNLAYMSFKV